MFRKQMFLLILALVCGVSGSIIFIYSKFVIPREVTKAENLIRQMYDDDAVPKVKVAVIVDKDGITKYTVLDEKILNEKVKIVDIPVKYAAYNVVGDFDSMLGKIAKEDLRYGEQVVKDSLSEDEKWFDEYQRLKEYSVTNVVAGEVKTGNIVDILVNYGNGDYDVVVPKIKVQKLIEAGSKSTNTDTSGYSASTGSRENNGEYLLIVAVNEEQYRDLEAASKIGKLQTRLYIDESQPASPKTFNYEKAAEKLKLSDINRK